MYPETMANDNPDLAGSLSPRRGSGLADRWRTVPGCLGRAALYLMLVVLFDCEAEAAEKLRLAVQKTGTFAWELALIRERGLDRKAGLDIEVTELASPEAAKIALMGGAADMILGRPPLPPEFVRVYRAGSVALPRFTTSNSHVES